MQSPSTQPVVDEFAADAPAADAPIADGSWSTHRSSMEPVDALRRRGTRGSASQPRHPPRPRDPAPARHRSLSRGLGRALLLRRADLASEGAVDRFPVSGNLRTAPTAV